MTLYGWQSAIETNIWMKVQNALRLSPVYLTHSIYRHSRQGQGWTQAFRFSGKLHLFLFNMEKKNASKWGQRTAFFQAILKVEMNQQHVQFLLMSVYRFLWVLEGIWRLLNGKWVSWMCECNTGALSFCCARMCVCVSYPLRSSLSSAATLRSSASISRSSCRHKKGGIKSLQRAHVKYSWKKEAERKQIFQLPQPSVAVIRDFLCSCVTTM